MIGSKKLPRSPWAHSKMLKLISWNINGRLNPWNDLLDSDLDVALLQEARKPRSPVATLVEAGPAPWQTS